MIHMAHFNHKQHDISLIVPDFTTHHNPQKQTWHSDIWWQTTISQPIFQDNLGKLAPKWLNQSGF